MTTQENQASALQKAKKTTLHVAGAPLRFFRGVNTFADELGKDPKLLLHIMALKGGASAIVLTAAFGIGYALTLPVALAATAVVGMTAVVALGIYGVVAGYDYSAGRVRDIIDRLRGMAPEKIAARAEARRNLPQKVKTWPLVEKIAGMKISRKIAQSRSWAITKRFVGRQQKWMIGSMALGGVAMSTVMAAWVLTAQLVVLPVVALGQLVTVTTVWALSGIVGGALGIKVALKNIAKWGRLSREAAAAAPTAPTQPAPEIKPEAKSGPKAEKRAGYTPLKVIFVENNNGVKKDQAPDKKEEPSAPAKKDSPRP